MAAPSFVNAGTAIGGSGATITPALPGSRVTNRVLIAFVTVEASGKTISVGGGWTIFAHDNTNASVAIAWRLVDGTEAAPVFSWTGAATCAAGVQQYTGNATPTPVGTVVSATAASSTTLTAGSLTSSADNSFVGIFLFTSNNQVIPDPVGYQRVSTQAYNGGNGSFESTGGPLFVSGQSSAPISVHVTAANWNSFVFEILGTGTGTTGEMRASQSTLQVPLSYSSTVAAGVLTAYTSQVTAQVAETYSTPILEARTTQIMLMVLRTEAIAPLLAEPGSYLITGYLADLTASNPPELIHRKIRDPWDCDEWGRFQPGACIRPIY